MNANNEKRITYGAFNGAILTRNNRNEQVVRLLMPICLEQNITYSLDSVPPEVVHELSQRFNCELSRIQPLRAKGISIPSMGAKEDTAYVDMPFYEGTTLYDLIKYHGPFTEEKAIKTIIQILNTLDHIHSMHMAHGYLSANGIIVKNDDSICILGFGIPSLFMERYDNAYYLFRKKEENQSYCRLTSNDYYSVGRILLYLLTGHTEDVYPSYSNKHILAIIKKTEQGLKGYHSCKEFIHDLDLVLMEPKTEYDSNQVGIKYYILEHKVNTRFHRDGEKQTIIEDQIELGRDSRCQVRFDESFGTVSRIHAAIVRDGGNWKLVQRSQTSTTLVNGKSITNEWYLQNGDEIQLAENGPKLVFIVSSENLSTVNSNKTIINKIINLFKKL